MNHLAEIEHAEEKHYDPVGARVGMWLFLFTEILLFGGLFLLYSIYLNNHPQDFRYGSSELDQFLGAMNTIILLTSSLTMALSVASLQRRNKKLTIILLAITIILGSLFLVNKYFEWGAKISHGIYPNSPELLKHSHGEILFYSLYFMMTGLHGLHVLIGVIIMGFMLVFISKSPRQTFNLKPGILKQFLGKQLRLVDDEGNERWRSRPVDNDVNEISIVMKGGSEDPHLNSNIVKLENTGLYWHLVDIIWIFLFPLFYLISM